MPEAIFFRDSDYRGRLFRNFHVRRGGADGPGWHIYGRCHPDIGQHTYGGTVISHCAWPDKPARKWPGWNCQRNAGWRRKRDAMRVADALNKAAPPDFLPLPPCPVERRLSI